MSNFLPPDWLTEKSLLAIPFWNWGLAVFLGAGSFIVMLAVQKFAVSHLQKQATDRAMFVRTLTELLSASSRILFGLAAAIIGLSALNLSQRWTAVLAHLWFIVLALQVGLWLNRAVALWSREQLPNMSGAHTVMTSLLELFVKAFVWVVVLLAILENAGVNITALVASLGIGGVAIALAVQTILSDLFASISIAVDKPFQVGDFIVAGDSSGNIEHIGLKSTRIRGPGGGQLVSSNTELLKRTIQNFKRMKERTVVFRFDLSYGTPAAKIEKIPALIKQVAGALPDTKFGRAHFVKLGAAGLEFEVVYQILDASYDRYMEIQQSINLGILRMVDGMGVEFAQACNNPAVFRAGFPLPQSERPNNMPEHRSH